MYSMVVRFSHALDLHCQNRSSVFLRRWQCSRHIKTCHPISGYVDKTTTNRAIHQRAGLNIIARSCLRTFQCVSHDRVSGVPLVLYCLLILAVRIDFNHRHHMCRQWTLNSNTAVGFLLNVLRTVSFCTFLFRLRCRIHQRHLNW